MMNQTGKASERIAGMDFIRCMATLGVFLYHFSGRSDCAWFQPFHRYANGDWGSAWVGLFFMLSGALLYRRNRDHFSPAAFYRKRWRAIYPEFWLAFALIYAKNVLENHSFFYRGSPHLLLLSVLGLDGYFRYRGPNYYIIGEWFLGAIILIYLLYPLLRRAFARFPHLLCALLLAACLVIENTSFFKIDFLRNLIFCIFEFSLGMLLMLHRERLSGAPVVFACLSIEIALIAIPIPLPTHLFTALHACALYVLLGKLGAWIEANLRGLSGLVRLCAAYSYSIYLTHHILIGKLTRLWNPTGPLKGLALLALCLGATLISAAALHGITQWLLNLPLRRHS